MNGQTIFVFGSNLAGQHGAGAALVAARQWQAQRGVGEGRTGYAYAIPTKDSRMNVRSLEDIRRSVRRFRDYALAHPDLQFYVTPIGCGLAGYKAEQIAPMFYDTPHNCDLPAGWRMLAAMKG